MSASLTKKKIANAVAARTKKFTQMEAFEAVDATLNVIIDELASGGHIELRGFGVFEIVTKKRRIGRNPNKPEIAVEIPERKVVKFRPGNEMAARVLQLQK